MKRLLLISLLMQCICSYTAAQQPQEYFDAAFDIIRKNYYRADEVDFRRLRAEAASMLQQASSTADTYPAIEYVLHALNDKHCRLLRPPAKPRVRQKDSAVQKMSFSASMQRNDSAVEKMPFSASMQRNDSAVERMPFSAGMQQKDSAVQKMPFSASMRDGHTAVLALYSYSSAAIKQQRKVADSLYALLRDLAAKGTRRLVIDLRKMEGGSNAPFLCGLGALTRQEHLFTYFVSRRNKTEYRFLDGSLWRVHRKARFTVLSIPEYESLPDMKIALITGPYTASAAEIITIIFKGLPHCRSFGISTYGVPTGVAVLPLGDGARIALASSVPLDRQGKRYTGPIAPDVPVDDAHVFTEIDRYFDL